MCANAILRILLFATLAQVVAAQAGTGTAGETFGLGRSATPEEIARIDIDIMPDGRGLPAGSGTVDAGRALYGAQCAACHGEAARGGSAAALAGDVPVDASAMAADPSRKRTIGNYWPYATTVFDYIRRAMPFDRPGSLADDEVYALTAYLLHLNGLISADARIDAASLPAVEMPARALYQVDNRSQEEFR